MDGGNPVKRREKAYQNKRDRTDSDPYKRGGIGPPREGPVIGVERGTGPSRSRFRPRSPESPPLTTTPRSSTRQCCASHTKPCFISDRATQLSSPPPPLSAHPLFTTPDNHPPTSTHRRPSQPPSLQFHPPSLRMIGSIGALSREKGPALHIPCDQTILLTSHPSIPLQPPLTPLP